MASMHYGLLKAGAESLFVRPKPGSVKQLGVLHAGVSFWLTGEKVTNKIEWVEGHYHTPGGGTIKGWVARRWLDIFEVEDSAPPKPVELPPPDAMPIKISPEPLFRNQWEAFWQLYLPVSIILAIVTSVYWLMS